MHDLLENTVRHSGQCAIVRDLALLGGATTAPLSGRDDRLRRAVHPQLSGSETRMSYGEVGHGEVQLSSEQIAARIRELGAQITKDYAGREPHLICVLNGAFLFMADLVRSIELPLTVDFLAVSSYGSETKTSGEVRLTKDLSLPLHGRDVILVEDIVDTGLTMNYLLSYLEGRGPKSLTVAALLSKPSRRRVEVPVGYMGFEIPDAYVYGYGLDRAHYDRNIAFISSVKTS
jgi:hypoxanthine phosphoribosyltransferase